MTTSSVTADFVHLMKQFLKKTRLEQVSNFVYLFCNLHQILIIEAIHMYKE